jgi:hypothetical protein
LNEHVKERGSAHLNQWLGRVQCEGSKPLAQASRKDDDEIVFRRDLGRVKELKPHHPAFAV